MGGATTPQGGRVDLAQSTPGHVLHLVGRITDTVFSFLGPATSALAATGVAQTIVLLDDARSRHVLSRFDPTVRLVLVRADTSFRSRHAALLRSYCDAVRSLRPTASHLHGVVCLLLGLHASRSSRLRVPIFFTPHGSRTLAGLWNPLARFLTKQVADSPQRLIASSGSEAARMQRTVSPHTHLVEGAVASSFLGTQRLHGLTPRIASGHDAPDSAAAALFAQCAVRLLDQMADLQFMWLGTAGAEDSERLKAAGVTIVDSRDDETRAELMATAWLFVAVPSAQPGFPVLLAEAMTMGIACVAWDTANHRDLIDEGTTGFLCRDPESVIARLAELLEDAPMRHRIAAAARVEANSRFDAGRLHRELLDIYRVSLTP